MKTLNSHVISRCQFCVSDQLESVVFLGYVPPVNEMLPIGSTPDAEIRFPLEMLRCPTCGLAQIGYEVDPEILFPHTYPYLSGTTRILRDNFKDLAEEAAQLFNLTSADLVIDIGANDGTLLTPFKEKGCQVLGIEPSQAAFVAQKIGIPMVKDYFGLRCAESVRKTTPAARVVTAANVFAHIKGVHEIMEAVLHLLASTGIFISESHYLLDLVETLQYDTIYHEHLRYYSLHSLSYLFAKHGMEIIRVKRIPTHGGSIRVYAARKGQYPIDRSVGDILNLERSEGIDDGSIFKSFRERVTQSKLQLLEIISQIKSEGKRIYGVGAPSRASTLINYAGIDDGLIDCVLEVASSHKLNKYIPGTRIPVVDEKRLFTDPPDYVLLFSWHIGEELAKLLQKKGYQGKFIVPLPTPRILELTYATVY